MSASICTPTMDPHGSLFIYYLFVPLDESPYFILLQQRSQGVLSISVWWVYLETSPATFAFWLQSGLQRKHDRTLKPQLILRCTRFAPHWLMWVIVKYSRPARWLTANRGTRRDEALHALRFAVSHWIGSSAAPWHHYVLSGTRYLYTVEKEKSLWFFFFFLRGNLW